MPEALIPNNQLPEIPSKRYFTIGEVSNLCGVKAHVLRYWEQEFPMLKPMKRRGNRRYYQRDDVLLIRHIRSLLYEHGYTISGARQKIQAQGITHDALPAAETPVIVEEAASSMSEEGGHMPDTLEELDMAKMIRQLEMTVKVLKS